MRIPCRTTAIVSITIPPEVIAIIGALPSFVKLHLLLLKARDEKRTKKGSYSALTKRRNTPSNNTSSRTDDGEAMADISLGRPTKRKRLYSLFEKGVPPSDDTVRRLAGKDTVRKYYREWREGKFPQDTVKTLSPAGKGAEKPVLETKEDAKNTDEKVAKQKSLSQATILALRPTTYTCALTPIMQIGLSAAVREWDWAEDTLFEDFLDTIIYHFFQERGIILSGYVVEHNNGNGKEPEMTEDGDGDYQATDSFS